LVRFYLLFCGEFFRLVVGAMASFHLLPLVICTAFKLYISMTRAKVKCSRYQLLERVRQSRCTKLNDMVAVIFTQL
jgi:hypothetical protein